MTETDIERVLIFRIGSLGDTVITLPCLHLVARSFPNAKRILITNRPRVSRSAASMAILGGSGLIDRSWLVEVGVRKWLDKLMLLARIRLYRPQVMIYLSEHGRIPYMHRDRAFFRLAGVKRIYGMGGPEVLDPRFDPQAREMEPEAYRLARSLAELGDAELHRRESWDLHLSPAERRVASDKLRPLGRAPFLACAPGTNKKTTDWGRERWRALFAVLSQRYPEFGIVLVGAADDAPLADYVAGGWSGPKLNLCGQLVPRETAAVLERASAYLGPDSGPMHLAAAVGTRCVVPFSGRVLPRVWFPFGDGHKVLFRRTECVGCKLDVCTTEKHRCLTSISVDDVAAAVAEVLEGGAAAAGRGEPVQVAARRAHG